MLQHTIVGCRGRAEGTPGQGKKEITGSQEEILAEPCGHKPKENNSREDKGKSLSQQPRHPGVGALTPWHRRRRGKGTTSPTLSYGLPPSPHSITAGMTGSMGKQTLSSLPSKSRVHPASTKINAQDAFKQQPEKSGAGVPKERECV